MKRLITLLVFIPALLICQETETKYNDLFEGHPGTIVIFDAKNNKYIKINEERAATRYPPASTFKIPNSLIGLETGVIEDENFVIKWDGTERWNSDWNKDHTLSSAIKYSVVPYYQELARRIGLDRMQDFLDLLNYGNKTIGERVDTFWLDGSLQISASEQVEFLKNFYIYRLPFSRRSIDIVKNILSEEKYPNSVLKFKTGTGTRAPGEFIGWLVGYVEKSDNVFLFAFNVDGKTFDEAFNIRAELSRKILKELKVIE
jgi:beta-lactamase class D